jgi:predicted metal-binding protein
MTEDMIFDLAKECGFECMGSLNPSQLEARYEVRDMCASGTCQVYGHNWACPPACNNIEEYQELFSSYTTCIVVQTVVQLEDEFDIDTMLEGETIQKKRFLDLVEKVQGKKISALFLSAGACTICDVCTYPEKPCRFPNKRLTSMEAAGLIVSDVCAQADIPYNHGKKTLAYTSCVLY